MIGDFPLNSTSDDTLGLSEFAEHIAKALCAKSLADGFVVAIEGTWGSGKTSLMRLALNEVAASHDNDEVIVLEFKPWLISNHDALLESLLDDLARKIDQIQAAKGNVTGKTVTKTKDIANNLRKFGRKLKPLEGIASLANSLGVPAAGLAEATLKGIGQISTDPENDVALAELKNQIHEELADLGRRIVVVIDDLDRLEPREIMEVLRLIRSVADFPNIVYLLCYDPMIVALAVNSAAGIEDGRAYLEKIVQLQLPVPLPENEALTHMFSKGLETIVGEIEYSIGNRIALVIDRWGRRYLTTPRTVVRSLDSIRFAWAASKGKVDASDLVWLHLVKIGNPKLYEWTESYLTAVAASRSIGTTIDEEEQRRSFGKFKKAVKLDTPNIDLELVWLQDILPAIASHYNKNDIPIFQTEVLSGGLIKERRLASPDHYRIYFAGNLPARAPSETEIRALIASADENAKKVSSQIVSMIDESKSAARLETVVNRLRTAWLDTLSETQARTLILGLADICDDARFAENGDYAFGRPSIWLESEWLLKAVREKFEVFTDISTQLFSDSKAVGWLTSLVRSETFSQGLQGGRIEPESDWLFSKTEFAQIVKTMHNRYAKMSLHQILSLPLPSNVFYAWSQSGGQDAVQTFLRRSTRKNVDFIAFMEHAYNRSSGSYRAIDRETFEQFLDYDKARARISKLAKKSGPLNAKATRIEEQFINGESDWP